ncbi:tripartite tricarboxylate transporter TctB family protein [Ancylobacter pratisalsi]|uniref:Tripartite tricarboxylate transporter TctB family protein n=1 Tax=Ancylobacter pratisalsi TaxID=1745854 RepID=A0A6P1YL63_9HYPH|nr:tripartite tricarboxylate transporter TctB family protein [Ancylobacter pratisalsi]QIB32973.1 tripartite tricarboxylate transporter TctB family protein [Ancylobacter pratisalsi]
MSSFDPYEIEPGLSRRLAECSVAVILFAISIGVLWDSYRRGAGWSGGPQSGFFPARVAWILLAASMAVFYQGLRASKRVLVTWAQLRQVGQVFLPLTVYVLAIGYLGIYVASAIFIGGFMAVFGKFRWWAIVAASVMIPLVTFWTFERQFQVPLPKGPLEIMLGY